jgi:cyanophycin synthetase
MPINVRDLRGFDGPNLYYEQPAVKLQVWNDRDISADIANTLKIWAQVTGTVIGYLRQDVEEHDGGFLMTLTFTTPFPNVGERIAEGVVSDLQASEQGDEEYSHDDLLFEVMRLRKREEPALPLLQIFAEARARDLPFLHRDDGTIMVGSGSRGFVFDPAGLSLGLNVEIPWDNVGRVPVLAVTGTNGKTTTVRLCARILEAAGSRVGRTDTDGIVIAGTLVESGDWAGFGGARRVLGDPGIDIAVLETSRGGILRRGLGFDICDVSIITNVSDDHLGEYGIDTVEEMALVKGIVALVTHVDGRVVLNADDPNVVALAPHIAAPIVWFTRQADNAWVEAHREIGGDAVWCDDTHIYVVGQGQQGKLRLADIPIVLGGAATHNVENVLAATGACVALGVPIGIITTALQEFDPSPDDNYGRLNLYRAYGRTVILDYAHNEAGIGSLMELGKRLRNEANGRLIVLLGGPGDRSDGQMRAQGRLVGAAADLLLLHDHERYRRGRAAGETPGLYRAGALDAGLASEQIMDLPDEVSALQHALDTAATGDVIIAAAHAQREELIAFLTTWERESEIPQSDDHQL